MNQNPASLITSIVQALIKTRAYPMSVNMKRLADELATKYNMSAKHVRSAIKPFDHPALKAIKARIEKARTDIKRKGLPNPSANGFLYIQKRDIPEIRALVDAANTDIEDLKQDALAVWPDILTAAKAIAGDCAAELEWPTAESCLKRFVFDITWQMQPAPLTSDTLIGLTDEVAAITAAESEDKVKRDLHAAHFGPVRELVKDLTTLLEGNTQTPAWDDRKRFKQDPFDNIKESVQTIKDLNWLNLPELDSLLDVVQTAGNVNIVTATEQERKEHKNKVAYAKQRATEVIEKAGLDLDDDLGI